MFNVRNRIERKYRAPKESIYEHRFFTELASSYSFSLRQNGGNSDFFTFEPQECVINKLLKSRHCFYSSYDIEQIISRITYSLMSYGSAYLYIHPEYSIKKNDDGTEKQVLDAFEIGEVRGIIKKHNKDRYEFYRQSFDKKIDVVQFMKNQLIIFDIKELGFSNRYFANILRKLSRCDITSISTDLIVNKIEGYDFVCHSECKRIDELKATKEIGWTFRLDGLSDSYCMYRKIQEDELKIQFLEYIIKKINEGLHEFLGCDAGELVAHMNIKDGRQLWSDYSEGKITGTELRNLLYSHP